MNPAASSEIEKDLVRWSRMRWAAIVIAILVAQGALLLKAPRPIVPASREPVASTQIRFAQRGMNPELSDLQRPTLFASASSKGFSGRAWLAKAPWSPPDENGLPRAEFLRLEDARAIDSSASPGWEPAPAYFSHARPLARPDIFESPSNPPDEPSRFRLEGLENRALLSTPQVPVHYSTDALRPTVLQILVDDEGAVFSARVLNSSGSKTADSEALNLARKARFESRPPGQEQGITPGKIIFEWRTLDPGQAVPKGAPTR